MIRIAAVGDLHLSGGDRGRLRPELGALARAADILLVAGDLTAHGEAAEARVAAGELAGLGVPVVAVLGNHDHHAGDADAVRATLSRAGVVVLEGESVVLDLPGGRLGIAGAKGFGGGFGRAALAAFGEAETKAFAVHARERAVALRRALAELAEPADRGADVAVALTHYAPTADTLVGEPRELYAFLGGSLLGEAIDAHPPALPVHGHAHYGTLVGRTQGEVPVRNVAAPLLERSGCGGYAVFDVTARSSTSRPAAG